MENYLAYAFPSAQITTRALNLRPCLRSKRGPPKIGLPAPTALKVLKPLVERIQLYIADATGLKVWKSLVERLVLLRLSHISSAAESVEFLRHLLEISKDLLKAERADDDARINEIRVVDPRKGAITQIFEEFKSQGEPLAIENVLSKSILWFNQCMEQDGKLHIQGIELSVKSCD